MKNNYIDERGTEGYINLANKIIKVAARDYKRNLIILKKHPSDDEAQSEIKRIELFFYSSLYGALTTLDPEKLIGRIKEEAENECKRVPRKCL